jgi:hypothetical protein
MSSLEVPLLRSPRLSALEGIRHGFTTRDGGVSVGERSTLDLARRPGDIEGLASENWRRVAATLGYPPGKIALMSQVHGAEVLRVAHGMGPQATIGSADGAVTAEAGIVLTVRTADCVPVLFAAPGAVAVAHAGWRGVAAQVVARTLTVLCEVAGVTPDRVTAAIGPCISGPRYEVGDEVVRAIAETGVPVEHFAWRQNNRWRAAPGVAVAWQLREAGVTQVDELLRCTSEPLFFSHRLDGPGTGRQAGVIVRDA